MFEFDDIEYQESSKNEEGFFRADHSADLDNMKRDWLAFWDANRTYQKHPYNKSFENSISKAFFNYYDEEKGILAINIDIAFNGNGEKYMAVQFHKFLADNAVNSINGRVKQYNMNVEYSLGTSVDHVKEYVISMLPEFNNTIKLPAIVDKSIVEYQSYAKSGQQVIKIYFVPKGDYKISTVNDLELNLNNSCTVRFSNIYVHLCSINIDQHSMCNLSNIFELASQENFEIKNMVISFAKHSKIYGLGGTHIERDPKLLVIKNFNFVAKNLLMMQSTTNVQFVIDDICIAKENIEAICHNFRFIVDELTIGKEMLLQLFHWMTQKFNPAVQMVNDIFKFNFTDKNWPLPIDQTIR